MVWIRRFKWDAQYWISHCRWDIFWCTILFFVGMGLGIAAAANIEKFSFNCVIIQISAGTYSPAGAFIKALLMSALLMLLICFTGFFKLFKLCHYGALIFLGYRFGLEIIASSTVFVGYVSIVIISLPYYFGTAIGFLSLHLYIISALPKPRPNWWCYSPCMMKTLIIKGLYIMIPLSVLYLIIFIIQSMIIRLIFGI